MIRFKNDNHVKDENSNLEYTTDVKSAKSLEAEEYIKNRIQV